MRWPSVRSGMLLLALVSVPAAAAAQSGRRCNQVLPADARQLVNARGQEVIYFRDPVRMVCTGDLVIEADSAVFNRGESAMQLVGNVLYRDSTRQLTADWANYLGRPDELYARGSVVVRDVASGAVVDGDDLEFRRETDARPESYTIVRGRRPHAVIPPTARDPEADAPEAGDGGPVEVWGNRLELIGDAVFLALGDVEFIRGAMSGAADTMRFDQTAERLTLIGNGHVEDEEYRLDGDRIEADLPGDTLREVRAERRARLTSGDLQVRSERLRIALQDQQLERLEAWNPDGIARFRPPARAPEDTSAAEPGAAVEGIRDADLAATTALVAGRAPPGRTDAPAPDTAGTEPAPPRAVAIARDFTLRADSIDARAEGGQLRQVRAVSRAFGERGAETAGAASLVARDWIQGDTIIGFFTVDTARAADPDQREDLLSPPPATTVAQRPPATPAGDTAGDTAEVVLERIVVIGSTSPALSLYRLEPESPDDGRPINFMRATRIVLHLVAGELERVDADGPIEGLYLDPAAVARPSEPEEAPEDMPEDMPGETELETEPGTEPEAADAEDGGGRA